MWIDILASVFLLFQHQKRLGDALSRSEARWEEAFSVRVRNFDCLSSFLELPANCASRVQTPQDFPVRGFDGNFYLWDDDWDDDDAPSDEIDATH